MTQRVVISGLADGMGRRTALLLADRRVSIAGFDVDGAGLESLRAELAAKGVEHHLVRLDIRDRAGVRAFRDDVLEKWGYVDTVMSNVGVPFFGPFEEVDLEAALRAFEINVIGAAALFQSFLPGMRERRRGKLVAVASLVGRIPFPFESIYSSTKFAVEGMVQSLKFEVEPYGIQVALIEPAQVATGFAQRPSSCRSRRPLTTRVRCASSNATTNWSAKPPPPSRRPRRSPPSSSPTNRSSSTRSTR